MKTTTRIPLFALAYSVVAALALFALVTCHGEDARDITCTAGHCRRRPPQGGDERDNFIVCGFVREQRKAVAEIVHRVATATR